jgi:hypothetical protein
MLKTVEVALRLKRDFDVGMLLHVATPSLGTRLYEECVKKGYVEENLTSRAFAEVRQTRGMPLIKTEDFTPSEVKEIAAMAVRRYKKLSLINYFKSPGVTLKMAVSQPKIVLKFIQNLTAG